MKLPFKVSVKHVQINRANNMMLIIAAIGSVITAFSLISAKALLSQSSFQHKVLKAKDQAITALKNDISDANTLKTQYDVFENGNPNILGGAGGPNVLSNGPSDGDNARIVLDALPDQYDFPALTSSLEKIVDNDHVSVQAIGGTDNSSTTQSNNTTSVGQQSQPQSISFSVSAQTDYNTSLTLIKDLERSIRPFDITNLSLNGTLGAMTISVQANTYWQPAVSLQIGSKELRQ